MKYIQDWYYAFLWHIKNLQGNIYIQHDFLESNIYKIT